MMIARNGRTRGRISTFCRQLYFDSGQCHAGRAASPGVEDRPGDEQGHQQQAGQDAREKQPPDRGFGGDPVDDHRHRRRDQDAECAAGGDRARGDLVGIAALAHLGDAHLADRGAGGGTGAGHRGEKGAGAEVGHHQPARHLRQPAFERLVEIGPRPGRRDRRAHDDEHRDRQEREAVELAVEQLRQGHQRSHAVERQQEPSRDDQQAGGHGHPGKQHEDGADGDHQPDDKRVHQCLRSSGVTGA